MFCAYESSNEIDDYWLVFVVSISLLRGIVAYTSLNICEKNTQVSVKY